MAFNAVQFETLELKARAITRVLLQFRRSPLFLHLLQALVHSVQDAANVSHDVLRLRTPLHARNHCLDVLGRIVGQMRELVNFNQYPWFTPDLAFRGADYAPAWVLNAPLGDSFIADDATYRGLIEGKVFRNHIRYGSVPELKEVLSLAFGEQISFIRVNPMVVRVVVSATASDNLIGYIMQRGNTAVADDVFFLPFPATMQISQVVKNTAYEFENSLYEWGLATFTRNSTAYHPDSGAQVASGEPRYRKGGGIFVEEGTINLALDPRAMHLWSPIRVTLQANVALAPNGLQEATKVICTGAVDPYLYRSINTGAPIAGKTFTWSVWAWTDAGQPTEVTLFMYDSGITDVGAQQFVLTPTPQRFSITRTFAAGTPNNSVVIRLDPKQIPVAGDYLYCWGGQLEQKPYATTFTTGTRQNELPSIPTAGIVSPEEGTIELDVDVNDLVRRTTGSGSTPRLIHIGRTTIYDNGIVMGHIQTGPKRWSIATSNGTATSQINTDSDAGDVGTTIRISARWSSEELAFFVKGVKRGSVANPSLPNVLHETVRVGHRDTFETNFFANTFIGPVRFSSRARTDEELANTGPLVADAGTTALLTFNNHLKILSPYQGG